MKSFTIWFALAATGLLVSACGSPDPPRQDATTPATPVNVLSEDEEAEGWQLLFDGHSFDGWRGFNRSDIPENWVVTDEGEIHYNTSEADYDFGLITEQQFSSFELSLEWKVAPGGNSGIFFRVKEDGHEAIWTTGPEYQVVDNANHPDGQIALATAGSNYGLHGAPAGLMRPAGEYNEARLVVNGPLVEHWLNGQKVVAYELGSEAWEAAVAASGFGGMPEYGRVASGHIALQDGGPVWYRNIKIRPL